MIITHKNQTAPPTSLLFISIFFSLLITTSFQSQSKIKGISHTILQKHQNDQQQISYTLSLMLGGKTFKLQAGLQQGQDWIVGSQCMYCQGVENIQSLKKEKGGVKKLCKQGCFQDNTDKLVGLQCKKGYCKQISSSQSIQKIPNFIIESQQVTLSPKIGTQSQKSSYNTIIIQKTNKKLPQIGHLNLLNTNNNNNENNIFGKQIVIIKNNAKDISLYYRSNNEKQINQNQNQKMLMNNQQFRKQIIGDIVRAGASQNQEGKMESAVLTCDKCSDQEQDQDEDEEQQSSVKKLQYQISQIVIENIRKENSLNLQKQTNEPQPKLQVQLQKTTISFALNTTKLLLPSSIIKKLSALIIKKYQQQASLQKQASSSQYIPPQCSIQKSKLLCQKSSQLKLSRLDNIQIVFQINPITKIQIPIRSLVQSCSQKQCSLLIAQSLYKKQIILGDFIWNIFAGQISLTSSSFLSSNTLTLYRLNNQWSQLYTLTPKKNPKNINFIWLMFLLIFKGIFLLLKIIMYISLTILAINFIYHWREVMDWVVELWGKLGNKQDRKQLRQESIKKLGLKFHKMSDKIKNRINKHKNKNKGIILSSSSGSHYNLGQQLNQLSQRKIQAVKLISVNELDDHENSSVEGQNQNQDDHEHQRNNEKHKQFYDKKRLVQEVLSKAHEDIVNKLETRGVMPVQLIMQPINNKNIVGVDDNISKSKSDSKKIETEKKQQQRQELKNGKSANMNQESSNKQKEKQKVKEKQTQHQKQKQKIENNKQKKQDYEQFYQFDTFDHSHQFSDI